MKRYTKMLAIFTFASLMVYAVPSYDEDTPSWLAYHSPQSKELQDSWLPNLTGLPDKEQVDQLTNSIVDLVLEEEDSQCNQIDSHLRMMVFQHFVIFQYIANKQNIYFDEQIARKWAHVLAMILKESSGDSTNISDMQGHSMSTYSAHTNLQNWRNLFSNAIKNRIQFNYQTNFGLAQISADRLFVAFNLAKSPGSLFLEGDDASTLKIDLNTAIIIRRLIWFYQDFAQGRISQSDQRINQEDTTAPMFLQRYHAGLKKALVACGTHFLFHEMDNNTNEQQELSKLEQAMASIAYCKLGHPLIGYGKDEFDEKCFADWVTLCPALNIDIALFTPLKYFETRNATPVCEKTFKRMINKKPDIK
ncbi:hypothetical protein [Legionella norrlandica]|nr:hypothetical protein [Legionella norrlandica]